MALASHVCGWCTRWDLFALLAKLENNNMEAMLAKPISFDSDIRQQDKYQAGGMTISNISASHVVPSKQTTLHWLDEVRMSEREKKKHQTNKWEVKRNRDLVSVQEVLCAAAPSSIPALFYSNGALWWKNVKWSRFCEHHLAARALIAPITPLTFLPAYYTMLVHLTLRSAGGRSIRDTHNGASFNLTMRTLQTLTTTKAHMQMNQVITQWKQRACKIYLM